jgi:hypothetical protein
LTLNYSKNPILSRLSDIDNALGQERERLGLSVRERLEGKAKAMAAQPTPQNFDETGIRNITDGLK